jgi:Holliday junction resolvase-like predicted endonuclease
MKDAHVGAVSELAAASWLLGQGYEVFRNVSAHGPADLIAWNPETGEKIVLDVTTARPYVRQDGTVNYQWASTKLKKMDQGIRVLVYVPEEDHFFWAA